MSDRNAERDAMVRHQLVARGIDDGRVIDAMRRVPEHEFVPPEYAAQAYDDCPLPIGHGATISQPYIVAFMTQALELTPTDRVLEIGTGSGYAAAVLAEIAEEVVTIETIEPLASAARDRLAPYGDRVRVISADGSIGRPELAPYDAISVTAAAPEVPPPLIEQLEHGGRLIMPVGSTREELVLLRRSGTGIRRTGLLAVRFVPLTGAHGAHGG